MSPDSMAHLKADLSVAGNAICEALAKLEAFHQPSADTHTASGHETPVVTQASNAGPGYMVFISSTHESLAELREVMAAWLKEKYPPPPVFFDDHASNGFSFEHSAAILVVGDLLPVKDKTPSLIDAILNGTREEAAMDDFLQHSVISFLHNSDFTGLAKFTAAVPGADHIEFDAPVRHDAGIYAPSILAYNGRSLDPHDPWHLNGLLLPALHPAASPDSISHSLDDFALDNPKSTPHVFETPKELRAVAWPNSAAGQPPGVAPAAQESFSFFTSENYKHGTDNWVVDKMFPSPFLPSPAAPTSTEKVTISKREETLSFDLADMDDFRLDLWQRGLDPCILVE